MNSPRCMAAQNRCTTSVTIRSENLAIDASVHPTTIDEPLPNSHPPSSDRTARRSPRAPRPRARLRDDRRATQPRRADRSGSPSICGVLRPPREPKVAHEVTRAEDAGQPQHRCRDDRCVLASPRRRTTRPEYLRIDNGSALTAHALPACVAPPGPARRTSIRADRGRNCPLSRFTRGSVAGCSMPRASPTCPRRRSW